MMIQSKHAAIAVLLLLVLAPRCTEAADRAFGLAAPSDLETIAAALPLLNVEGDSADALVLRSQAKQLTRGQVVRIVDRGQARFFRLVEDDSSFGDRVLIGESIDGEPDRLYIHPGSGSVVFPRGGGTLAITSLGAEQGRKEDLVKNKRATRAYAMEVVAGTVPSGLSRLVAYDQGDFDELVVVGASSARAVERLAGSNLGSITGYASRFSPQAVEVLALSEMPDLRIVKEDSPFQREGEGPRGEFLYQMYINGLPVNELVRVTFNETTGIIKLIEGQLFDSKQATPPSERSIPNSLARATARKAIARNLQKDELEIGDLHVGDGQLIYDYIDADLRLGWLFDAAAEHHDLQVFVDGLSGEAFVFLIGEYATCEVSSATVDTCSDIGAIVIIDDSGVCQNFCGTAIETAHRNARQKIKDVLNEHASTAPAGPGYDNEVDLIVGVTLPAGADGRARFEQLPGGAISNEARIDIRGRADLENETLIIHEATHIATGTKAPGLRSGTEHNPGKRALNEGVSYVLEELIQNRIDGLRNDGWHAEDFDDYPPSAPVFTQATSNRHNARILEQAIYDLITTSSIDIDTAKRLIMRGIQEVPDLSTTIQGTDWFGQLHDAMRDEIESMADDDIISGSQKRAWKDAVTASFGRVGLGPLPIPEGGTPPPAAPLLSSVFYSCGTFGETFYLLSWNAPSGAGSYTFYDNVGFPLYSTTSNSVFAWVNNFVLTTNVRACGSGGCSGPSNAVTLTDTCSDPSF